MQRSTTIIHTFTDLTTSNQLGLPLLFHPSGLWYVQRLRWNDVYDRSLFASAQPPD